MADFEITLSVDSRYHKTSLLTTTVEGRNVAIWGVWDPIVFDDEEDDQIHMVRSVDLGRLDTLANRFYGNPNMWWVIATKNLIKNQLTDMRVGQRLRIPQRSSVLSKLLAADNLGVTSNEEF
jgi:hypothetical protein